MSVVTGPESQPSLRPADWKILRSGASLERQGYASGWGWKNVRPAIGSYGYFRHRIRELGRAGLVQEVERSSCALYRLTQLGHIRVRGPPSPPASALVSQTDLLELLDSLELQPLQVHNVRLAFVVPFSYRTLQVAEGWKMNPANRLLTLQVPSDASRRLTLSCTPNMMEVFVACSRRPFEASVGGILELASVAGHARHLICGYGLQVPEVSEWVVTQCEFNRNSRGGISGPRFNVTFTTFTGALARIYTKEGMGVRVEAGVRPNRSLPGFVEDALGVSALRVLRELTESVRESSRVGMELRDTLVEVRDSMKAASERPAG